MIEYLEVRSKQNRELIGIIDGFVSVIWHSAYFGVGDFEVYAPATMRHLELLQKGNYITRPNDNRVGIIENLSISNNAQDGLMITASGRFAKSILDRRHIYQLNGKTNTATILRGNVEENIRKLVTDNAINCAFDSRRNIPILQLGELSGIPDIIVDDDGNATQKQVSFANLLEYTESVLEEYGLGSIITLDDESKMFLYKVYSGTNRSIESNTPIIFSREFDNLSESNYSINTQGKKTAALIGGEGEGLDRFYSLLAGAESGLDRRETWVDASSISQSYQEGETEKTYTDEEYKAMLDAQGKQELAVLKDEESFEGSLVIDGGVWRLNEDYFLGDVVTVQDNTLGKVVNVRITEVTEVQDSDGYIVEVTYRS